MALSIVDNEVKQYHNQIVATSSQKMIVATIGVCTYKRPKMLSKCLNSLLAQEVPNHVVLHIVVVDNDVTQSGKRTFVEFANLCGHWTSYQCQPKRGIAAARNVAREYALSHDADYLLFIDDDEEADPNWVNSLLHPDYANTPILCGWNIMDYPPSVPEWARGKAKPGPKEGERCFTGFGNARIAREVFEKIKFDESLGLAGGEDGQFAAEAMQLGHRGCFTRRAITFEYAHPIRYTLAGILSRTEWVAAANLRMDFMRYGKAKAIARKMPEMVFCLPLTAIEFAFGLIRFSASALANRPTTKGRRGMLKAGKRVARALGYWDAITGHAPQTYAHIAGE